MPVGALPTPSYCAGARLGRAPDRGDAMAMTMYADHLAASEVHASGGQRDGTEVTDAKTEGEPFGVAPRYQDDRFVYLTARGDERRIV
ncbi:hypothetical protein ABZT06_38860 [Streptomyces sp. NPDC005483]|uniref:hypothetical protein n=1 Tax=Streptomyces sp. NPDC005483 TaxID=3154882 RepID=UPI0033A74BE9